MTALLNKQSFDFDGFHEFLQSILHILSYSFFHSLKLIPLYFIKTSTFKQAAFAFSIGITQYACLKKKQINLHD